MTQLPTAHAGLAVITRDLDEIVAGISEMLEHLSGRTVLLTGASGFLPGYLADVLAVINQRRAISRPMRLLYLVRSAVQPGSRLGHLLDRPDIEFIVQDVCQPLALAEPIHYIIHAASPASPKYYRADPVATIDANSIALRQLLEHARHSATESFLYFSSSEVYGQPEPEQIPTPESYPGRVAFTSGRACYAESKRFGETLCCSFYEQYGVPVKIVRPFHVHGPGLRLDDGRIVAEMIACGIYGQPFSLLSDGQATRTYGYVSDATIAFLRVLLSDLNGEAFNVGADSPETTILELATTIAQIFGRSDPVRVNLAQKPEHLKGAPARVCPDLSKIRRLLGYQPAIGLEEGLRRTIHWHQLEHAARKDANG